MDRIAPTRRPAGKPQGSQRWHRLLFSHWQVPEAALRPLVPEALQLDAFEGRCYVGVVSFLMQNVRPFRWAPSVPTAREFGEINVRTYVHLDGREPGVFFFSLDAASSLVVWVARTFWSLPYYRAEVAATYADREVEYRSQRRGSSVAFATRASIGQPLPASKPSSLEFFLCERYQFYAQSARGLQRARVHHTPYELHAVEDISADPSLVEATGLPVTGARPRDLYSPGVDVEVFGLTDV
jgi:uncharacterized protein YqjF (DUF2071 family)